MPASQEFGPRQKTLAILATVAALALLLSRYPPDRYNFYPRCPSYTALHLLCPGCGATRAIAYLLHGNLRHALESNPLITLLLPATILYLLPSALRGLSGKPIHPPRPSPVMVNALLITSVLFAAIRNLVSYAQ